MYEIKETDKHDARRLRQLSVRLTNEKKKKKKIYNRLWNLSDRSRRRSFSIFNDMRYLGLFSSVRFSPEVCDD